MAPATSYARVVFAGYLPGGEIWNVGWSVGALPGPLNQGLADAIVNAADDIASGFDGGSFIDAAAANLWGASTGWNKTTAYLYAAGGGGAAFVGEKGHTPIFGAANTYIPNQCCIVASLRTGAPGRRNRGRMYFPCTGGGLDPGGELPVARTTAFSDAVAHSIADFNRKGVGNVCVVSQVGGTVREVVEVITDSRVDIQRRRANRQAVNNTRISGIGDF